VDRELLLELGCEELPASWLPRLTNDIGEVMVAELRRFRIAPESPAETFSTPRRLTVRVARVPERQTDLEELVTGPPVSAAFRGDGQPTPAAAGFAAKHGVDVSALERIDTPKGPYLAFRRHQRGRAAADVLPDVLGSLLRNLSFPKLMRWDAALEDGRGELPFGRPIRWILYVYGGRVVPFTISRTANAQSGQVQDVVSGAVTYGHRFLTTSGRAGRAIKVRTFDDYRARLLENFVILERSARHDKIARELDVKALRLKGRVSRAVHSESGLLHEVPDLLEYPAVVAGTFAPEFLDLPEEVLTTTLVHHQHYFPVEGEDGRLMPAFLAVINTEPDNERTIARNAERVVMARLRDARFFRDADGRLPLAARVDRLATLVFHKKLGTYREKAERMARLAAWIARDAFGAGDVEAAQAGEAARLAKADLTTDMVREFTELQGTIGGIYARDEGMPEAVWKAIYFQYLPMQVDADAPPTPAQLGDAAVTWAAVSLADKLDTLVGLFAAGEKPTGSRDPYGLRRAAQGVVKILADRPSACSLSELFTETCRNFDTSLDGEAPSWRPLAAEFMLEREAHLFERRGYRPDEARAVAGHWEHPHLALARIEALSGMRGSEEFAQLAALFKRVKNITKDVDATAGLADLRPRLREPAELALVEAAERIWPAVDDAIVHGRYADAMRQIVALREPVDRFFVEVLVMTDDPQLRTARLTLLSTLKAAILHIADIAEVAADERQA
jgi:glycyl-tRNA synthetase beta chain